MRWRDNSAVIAALAVMLLGPASLAGVVTDTGGGSNNDVPAAPPDSAQDGGFVAGPVMAMSASGGLTLLSQPPGAYAYTELRPGTISVRGMLPRAGSAGTAEAALPTAFALGRGTPNPFRGRVGLSFDLPAASRVRLEVLDIAGRLVQTIEDGAFPAGRYSRAWTGTNAAGGTAPSGMYFLRIDARATSGTGGLRAVEKLVLLR